MTCWIRGDDTTCWLHEQSESSAPGCTCQSHVITSQEEISHCAAGTRWLTYLFNQAKGQHPVASADSALEPQNFPDVQSWFHALVRQHFRGDLKVRDVLTLL